MPIKTLLEYATDKMLIHLLVKERAKFRRRNRANKHHTHKVPIKKSQKPLQNSKENFIRKIVNSDKIRLCA